MKAINMSVQSQFPTLGFLKPIWKGKIENHPETDFKFSGSHLSRSRDSNSNRTFGFKSCLDFKVQAQIFLFQDQSQNSKNTKKRKHEKKHNLKYKYVKI